MQSGTSASPSTERASAAVSRTWNSGHAMRLVSVHPGVSVADVVANTGFALVIDGDVPDTRMPTSDELHLIRDVIDPHDIRHREVP